MDSRVKFWTIREGWPRDTASHVFLGNAVNEIGKALFGSEWNGAEPCIESLFSWPKGKLERFGVTNEQVASDHAAKRSALERFSRVQDQIIQFAETEKLITALRPDAGGDPVTIHRSFWNSERLSVRFYRCQMNPRHPFDCGVAGDGYCWIFVTRESLEKCLSALAGSSQPESAAAAPGSETTPPEVATSTPAAHGTKNLGGKGKMTRAIQAAFGELWPSGEIPVGMSSQDRNDKILVELKLEKYSLPTKPDKRTIERALKSLNK
jgi:hypothetical protein